MTRARRHRERGFTLVELMVVVLIISVISALLISVNIQTYGTSSLAVADELVANYNLCKMRAVSTRHWHRCELTPTTLTIEEWPTSGMTTPGAGSNTGTWQTVQLITIGIGVTAWDANATPCAEGPCGGAPLGANLGLDFDVDFRPDGSSTGGTVFVSDTPHNKLERVIVYKATGSSYARNSW